MSNITLYLSELDQLNQALSTDATFTGTSSQPALTGTDATIYCQMPVANWRDAFTFQTDNSIDTVNEGVSLKVNTAKNLIGLSSATATTVAVAGMYGGVAYNISGYVTNTIKDVAESINHNTEGVAKMHFLQELSRAVFGSTAAVDLFTNESTLSTAYGTAIEACASNINNMFVASALPVLIVSSTNSGDIANYTGANSAEKVLQVAKRIYDLMRFTTSGAGGAPLSRFSMLHGATVPSNQINTLQVLYPWYAGANSGAGLATGAGMTALRFGLMVTSSGSNGAVLKGQSTSSVVEQLYVTTVNSVSGNNWQEGDKVQFHAAAGGVGTALIEIAALSDVQAAMLNGTLNAATKFPFVVNDTFNIQLSISNKVGQENTSGNQIAANQVNSKVNLLIKLV